MDWQIMKCKVCNKKETSFYTIKEDDIDVFYCKNCFLQSFAVVCCECNDTDTTIIFRIFHTELDKYLCEKCFKDKKERV